MTKTFFKFSLLSTALTFSAGTAHAFEQDASNGQLPPTLDQMIEQSFVEIAAPVLKTKDFFVTKSSKNHPNPGKCFFTKDSKFTLGADFNVVNSVGQYLQYFPYNLFIGTFDNLDTTNLDATQTLNVKKYVLDLPQPTRIINMALSLPGNAAADTTSAQMQHITVFDSLGGNHTLIFRWEKTAQVANTSQTWTLQVSSPTGAVQALYSQGVPIVFDGNGLPVTFNATPFMPDIDVAWPNGANNSTIFLDLGILGSANGVNAGGGNNFFLNSLITNGYRAGKLKDVMIDHNGEVTISFDTGAPALTIGRLAITTLPNFEN